MTDARQLGSRYQLGEVIGYGGMAEVHRGNDLRLGRDVAIKVLRADMARDPGFQARFRREAQNAASLNHPSIVAVYDTGEEMASDGVALPFIVMEFVEGRTLKEVLADEGRLMPERAMEITADTCAALDFSHRNGIVHRDVKPGNVMLNNEGAVKVMDFGIARALSGGTSTMTQTSAVIGTAQYLSPEQARGETVDARSDVYSTGCLLYELLIGHPPFTGDSPVSVAYQHVRENPIPPSQLNPDVTPDVDAIVLKAMAKNAANRYQTAGDMRADLLRAAAGRPVAATPVMSDDERTQLISPTRPNQRQDDRDYEPEEPNRRKGWLIAGIVVAVIAVFALAAFGTSYLLGNNSGTVTIPNVVGMKAADAKVRLTEAGFTAVTEAAETNASAPGEIGAVTRTDPAVGSAQKVATPITYYVKASPGDVTVPNFVGSKFEDAETTASGVKLKLLPKSVDSDKPSGEVVKQDKDPNTKVPANTVVTVEVSSGNKIKLPSVAGQNYDDAKAKLEGLGFVVNRRDVETADSSRDGIVKSQSPEGGGTHDKNTNVTLTVYKYKQPQQSPDPNIPPTGYPDPGQSDGTGGPITGGGGDQQTGQNTVRNPNF